ncbi:DNA polymerase III subunit beta [Candidatus Poribacteria bacterium]|nr:DNA polymerase III subunit beta [Candidatus Poribacteria bacterium]
MLRTKIFSNTQGRKNAMELIFEREDLLEAMQVVGNIAASRNTLPILANVLIRATEEHIQLAATDLEVGVKSLVEGEIKEPGSITIPARKLADIARELPVSSASGDPVKVSLKTSASDRVEIECENARFRMVGLSDEEFPPLPEIGDEFISLESDLMNNMIQKTVFAVSTEETRHFLNGIYLSINSDTVKMVATDGKRLAVAINKEDGVSDKEIGVIIPTKAVNNVLRTFTEDGEVKVALLENQIAFASEKMTLISRLIEGDYPDTEAVMSPTMSNEIKVTANTDHLLSVVRRVSLLANPKTPSIRMETNESELSISASTPELGEAKEQIQVDHEGGSIEIAFNARYVLDVLRNIESEKVLFKFRDSLSPVLVMPSDETEVTYMCVIMPMRL